ncbi:DUF948 domain-containing protein [Oceanobacillus neutriphilus]|uniref:DUF948 domain-containing protein n=1 Tax=Oceanobacillus neutriphilus TaxID=531815 RepID=A0ABQ2P1H3_9BACI|nr:DUF948 domain-containing protein [Oceanobacillus neutriphilus]GGP15635.1 hypothetical protein GCM10011346_44480 [Oceanobacillus neutriphilus]
MANWILILLGIGAVLIGIGLLAVAGFLFLKLGGAGKLIASAQKTTDQLPEQVEGITSQITDVLKTGNETLQQVNQQIKELSPMFYLVGDAGRATHNMTSSVLKTANQLQEKTEDADLIIANKNLQGIYGLATIGYFLVKLNKK